MSIFKKFIVNSESQSQKNEKDFLEYKPDCLWNNSLSASTLAGSDDWYFSKLLNDLYGSTLSSAELSYDIMLFINAAYSYIVTSLSAEDIVRTIPDLSDEDADDWVKYGHYKKTVYINETPYEFDIQRIYSRTAGRTHAIFPLGIIPFMRENLFDIYLYLRQISRERKPLEAFHGRLKTLLKYLLGTLGEASANTSDHDLSELICSFIADHFAAFYQNTYMTERIGLTGKRVRSGFLHDACVQLSPTWESCSSLMTVLNFFIKKQETA